MPPCTPVLCIDTTYRTITSSRQPNPCMQWAPPQSRALRAALFTAAGLLLVVLISMGTSGSRQMQQGGSQGGAAPAAELRGGTPAALRNSGAEKVGAGLLLT